MKKLLKLSFYLISIIILAFGVARADSDSNYTSWDYKYVPKKRKTLTESNSVYYFKLDPWMSAINNGFRSELTDHKLFHNGDSVHFEIWTKLVTRPGFGSPENITISQWHESLSRGSKRPPYAHRIRGTKFLITTWNDEVYDQAEGRGNGTIIAEFELKVNYWYHFENLIKFDPINGFLSVRVQECKTTLDCSEFKILFNQSIGIGYKDALNYYFKFGVYTTVPYSRATNVWHFMKPEWIYE